MGRDQTPDDMETAFQRDHDDAGPYQEPTPGATTVAEQIGETIAMRQTVRHHLGKQTPDDMETAFQRDHDDAAPHQEPLTPRGRSGNVASRTQATVKVGQAAQRDLEALVREQQRRESS
jgi:hypothetical protein